MNTTSSYEKKANLRILIVTDYTPPQTHGIAIRFQHYITNMRRAGHEVQVYSTNMSRVRSPACIRLEGNRLRSPSGRAAGASPPVLLPPAARLPRSA
eukprot:scaffold869_cov105-Isochrysis_galbana.AAC.35